MAAKSGNFETFGQAQLRVSGHELPLLKSSSGTVFTRASDTVLLAGMSSLAAAAKVCLLSPSVHLVSAYYVL